VKLHPARAHRPAVAGLESESLFGAIDGEPFTDDSSEYVFITRRPA
jgi:hypothetical protein